MASRTSEAGDHRPWPIPSRPWRWRQTWHDLLFLHWPLSASDLRPLVPAELTIETFSGFAWIGVIPFWMSNVSVRNCPALPGASRFPELNVRTYVEFGGRSGVWFLSLDAANRLAVLMARKLFHLPYTHARMRVRREGERIRYDSTRSSGHTFAATYTPRGSPARTKPGSLVNWFTERYCLYAQSRSGQLFRAEIDHEPWPLQPVVTEVTCNDMLRLHGIELQGPAPQQQFARRLQVVVWSLDRIGGAATAAR